MKLCCIVLAVATFVGLLVSDAAFGQKKEPKPTITPADKLPEDWEEIDQRLVFLMVRLANVEASLDAVEKAIGAGTRKKAAKTGEGKRAEAGNDRMDRNGGGPMKWSEFYGTTAEAFFYHPTDRNSTYHTTTVLNQQGPDADNKGSGGVPAGQGVPIHQRPPQFDYIYRANANAKERAEAEAAELKGKVEELAERRNRLEAEQAGLWCEIAFRAVSHYDLDRKPIYRFEPIVGSETESRLHTDSMKAAASFMALALSIVDAAQKDQATTFSKIKPAVSEARKSLGDSWLQLGIDATDRYTTEGKFAALAKRLDDVASNLSDSYEVANEGAQAHDQQRKDTFRAMLQQSLVSYAQIILALDEMSTVMKNDWKITPDVKNPIQFVSLTDVVGVRHMVPLPASNPASEAQAKESAERQMNVPPDGFTALFNGRNLTNWRERQPGHWTVTNGILQYDGRGDSLVTAKSYGNFELFVDWKISPGGDSGIYLRGKPQVQIWDNPLGSGGLYNNKANPSTPILRADNPVGEWNTFFISMTGERVTVLLNGNKVVDGVILENYPTYQGRLPIAGTIELQHHSSPLWFRNIFIKELKAQSNNPLPATSKRGNAINEPLSSLKGTWLALTEEVGGKRIPKEEMLKKRKTLKIDRNEFTLSTTYYKIVGKATPVPDEGPDAIDLSGTYVEGGNGQAIVLRGRFDIKKRTLRLCYSLNDDMRPTEFETEEGKPGLCVTFERTD